MFLKFLDGFFGYGKKKEAPTKESKKKWVKLDLPEQTEAEMKESKFNPTREELQKLSDISYAAYQRHLADENKEKTLETHAFSFTRLKKGEIIVGLICFVYMLYRIFS